MESPCRLFPAGTLHPRWSGHVSLLLDRGSYKCVLLCSQHSLLSHPSLALARSLAARPGDGPERHHGARSLGSRSWRSDRRAVCMSACAGRRGRCSRDVGACVVDGVQRTQHAGDCLLGWYAEFALQPHSQGCCRVRPPAGLRPVERARAQRGPLCLDGLCGCTGLSEHCSRAGSVRSSAPRPLHLRRVGLWGPALVAGIAKGNRAMPSFLSHGPCLLICAP